MTRPPRTDVAIALGLTAAMVVEQAVIRGEPGFALMAVPGGLALAWRRVAPVTACLVTVVALGAPEFVERGATDAYATFAALILALFSLAAYAAPRRPVPAAIVATVVLSAVAVQASMDDQSVGEAISGGVLFAVIVVAGPALGVGLAARRHAELRRRLEAQARELEAERERRPAAAAEAERARVAAELHDVVADGVRVMLAELAGARERVLADPATAGPAILGVEERGREALAEMRRLLGVLRHGDEDLALAPHPSLARIADLARRRHDVSVRIEGTPRPLTAGLDVAAYRVVEEALAATAGAADIVVRYGPRDVALDVSAEGPELADSDALATVRERVALFSGRLDTGRRPRGGSALHAALPARPAT